MMLRNKMPPILSGGINYEETKTLEYTDRWVISQRDNISIAVKSGLLEISEDNSNSFIRSLAITNSDKIINAYIFRNGNIMLSTTNNKIFLTNKDLDFYIEKIVYKADGITPYPIHTPQNASFPGRYFYTHKYMEQTEQTDIYVFGNYCNVNFGAAPVIIVYTPDFGVTWKIAYEFGQHYRDNGTSTGNYNTGTILGNPNNPLIAKHTHHVEYNPENNRWYCFTGDDSPRDEVHWLEGVYDDINDSWSWGKITFNMEVSSQSRLKATEMFFHGGYLYWVTDATNVAEGNTENGLWRVKTNTINDANTHEKIITFPNYNDVCSNLKVDRNTGNLMFTVVNQNIGDTDTIGIAKDYGFLEVQYKTFVGNKFIRLNSPNSEGYFRLDTDRFSTLQNKSFLIKVGFDLFNNI